MTPVSIPDVGETGVVEISKISDEGNALVVYGDEQHLNIGPVRCLPAGEGDEVRVKRINGDFAKCIEDTKPKYEVEFGKLLAMPPPSNSEDNRNENQLARDDH